MKFLKTLTRLLVKASLLGLMVSVFLMAQTSSQFFDLEQSLGNSLEIGTLDLGLRSPQTGFVPNGSSMQPGNVVTRDIYFQNLGGNPFDYKGSYEFVSGDEDLCNGLELQVLYNGTIVKYSGLLKDFNDFTTNSPTHDPDLVLTPGNEQLFKFQITLPLGSGQLLGKTCTFNIKGKAWQQGLLESESGFWDEEVIQSTIGTQPLCEEGKEAVNVAPIDRVNIGDSLSENLHDISGWSSPNLPGNYGGKDDGTYRQIVEEGSCNDNGREAKFVLYAGSRKAQVLRIRALDGMSNLDSFEVYVNDNLVGTYIDTQDSAEIWHNFEVPLNNLSGWLEVKLKAIDNIWPNCGQYGQVAVSWAEIDGYYCSPDEVIIPDSTAPVCQEPQTPTTADPIDELNIGNTASESGHNMLGWSTANLPGGYGGKDDGSYRQVISEQYCSNEYRVAGFTLNTGGKTANLLRLRLLDGISNKDGFDVYVNDNFLAHLPDLTPEVSEVWKTYSLALPNLIGEIKVRLVGFDEFWNLCSTYGQVSASWANIGGYQCSVSQPQAPLMPEVIINEVMWMGSHESTYDEWIELYNTTASPIDLTNWTIANAGSGSNSITLSGPIPAGGYFLVSHYGSSASSINDSITVDQVVAGIELDNGVEQLVLRNGSNAVIDQTPTGAWPAGVNGTGDNPDHSMERNNGTSDGSLAGSWHTCTDENANDPPYWDAGKNLNYGTPKATNLSNILDTTLDFWISEDGHTVGFRATNISPYNNLNYFVSYESDGKPQGIGPSDVALSPGENQFTKDSLVLGSCSSGGTCTYHTGMKEIKLTVTLTGSGIPDRILTKSIIFE